MFFILRSESVDGYVLRCCICLICFCTGKQHGSLARAGKVRGQTPKVEKQDKKKKKTGRAKRRIQYNRRFVNVVGGQVSIFLCARLTLWVAHQIKEFPPDTNKSCYTPPQKIMLRTHTTFSFLCTLLNRYSDPVFSRDPSQFGGKKMSPNNIAVQQARAGVVADK